jgi:hypothetical protein
VVGRFGYGGSGTVTVVDFQNPSEPRVAGRCRLGGEVYDLEVAGRYAYLAGDGFLSDAASPGGKAFVVLDISDPNRPVCVGGLGTPLGAGRGVRFAPEDGWVLFLDASAGLVVIDVHDPTKPRVRGSTGVTAQRPGVGALGLGLQGTTAYVYWEHRGPRRITGLDILDVSRPDVPTRIARAPRWLPETVAQWRYWMTVGLGLTCLLLLAIGAPWVLLRVLRPSRGAVTLAVVFNALLATVLVGGALIRGVRLGARSLAAGDSLARLAPIALMVGALVLAVFLLAGWWVGYRWRQKLLADAGGRESSACP